MGELFSQECAAPRFLIISAFVVHIDNMAVLSLLPFFVGFALSQTFSDLALPPAIASTSDACKQSLSTVIDCPAILVQLASSTADLDSRTLNELCNGTCISSMVTAQSNIRQSCTGYFDFMIDDAVVWPGKSSFDLVRPMADNRSILYRGQVLACR